VDPKDLMIYSDMDGTLLSSWSKGPVISKRNEEAIRYFIKQGGLFSIATGRNMKNGPTYLENYPIQLPMVLVNGALIYDSFNQSIIRKITIDKSFVKEALEYFVQSNRIAVVISDINEVYHVIHPSISGDKLPELDFETINISISEVQTIDILKVTFVTHPEEKDIIEKDLSSFKTYSMISTSPSSKRFIEIVSAGINKAEAISYVKTNVLTFNRKLVCIGDYSNDIEMLDLPDIAAIPQNGLESLKKRGRLITSHHVEDAIDDLIYQLIEM
jgi:Cof subfamily protein (haloacid dehalogenase superfamily)